jgi:hypothetical protein
MANDKNQSGRDQNSDKLGQSGQKREIGAGMHSLDSTQAPLKAENAEVDWAAKNGTVSREDLDDDSSSSDRNR